MDKLYKDTAGNVYAYNDIQAPNPGLIQMTPEEVEAHLNPPPGPEPVPHQVTRAQGKAALITAGLWPDVLAYVEAMTDPTEKALAEVALNDTTHWQRTSPFLNAAAAALGLSDEQLDDLFRRAAEIEL